MANERNTEMRLPSLSELFSSQEERDDAKLKRIYEIPLDEIDPFPDHPFKVRDDEDMQNLVESVKANGVLTPATVRKKEDGRYELLSGHRRHRACKIAGIPTLRCEVVEMTRDEGTIFMVESNFQRSKILPSEKAFAYKMRLEAMNRLPGRPVKENLTPVVSNKLRTNEELGAQVGESRRISIGASTIPSCSFPRASEPLWRALTLQGITFLAGMFCLPRLRLRSHSG